MHRITSTRDPLHLQEAASDLLWRVWRAAISRPAPAACQEASRVNLAAVRLIQFELDPEPGVAALERVEPVYCQAWVMTGTFN